MSDPHQSLFLPFRPADDHLFLPRHPDPQREIGSDGLPLPPIPLLLGHEDSEQFLKHGLQHYGNLRRILRDDAGYEPRPGDRILDFGCGSGRLIRQWKDHAQNCEIWGVDVRSEHIHWCKENLSPPFRFAVTTLVPTLPFEDRSFDLIYAGSVFTHIDDLADAWWAELRRLLRPGGLLYLTVHDRHSVHLVRTALRDHPQIGGQFIGHHAFEHYSVRDYGMFSIQRSLESQVFYDLGYLRERLELNFEVLGAHEDAYGFQTAVLVQRPDTPAGAARSRSENPAGTDEAAQLREETVRLREETAQLREELAAARAASSRSEGPAAAAPARAEPPKPESSNPAPSQPERPKRRSLPRRVLGAIRRRLF